MTRSNHVFSVWILATVMLTEIILITFPEYGYIFMPSPAPLLSWLSWVVFILWACLITMTTMYVYDKDKEDVND